MRCHKEKPMKVCKICGKNVKQLRAHMLNAHSDFHRFTCDICGKKFKVSHYYNCKKRFNFMPLTSVRIPSNFRKMAT